MRHSTAFLIIAAGAALLAGCATGTEPGTSSTGGSSSSTARPSTPIVDRSEITVPTTTTAKTMRLTGRVAEGVEAGCTVLRTEAGATYTLVGELGSVSAGTDVTLRGRVDPDRVSTCQQGPVFVVEEVVAD